MSWFNYYGLIIVAIILIPNIIYALTHKEGFQNSYRNKPVLILEQIGRFACLIFIVFNIPYTWIGFYFPSAKTVYIAVNALLCLAYLLSWAILWKKNNILRALLLSVIPSLIFLFSGVMIGSILLTVFAVIFSTTHILISVKNAKAESNDDKKFKKHSIYTATAIVLTLVTIFGGMFGGLAISRQNDLKKLGTMTVPEMIRYDCTDKDKKISIAMIENGIVTYHIYGSDGQENKLYDYEIGSVSKTFVGLMCAKAVSEGKLNLSDSISSYLGFDTAKYYPTVERLLTHTSGYRPYYFQNSMIGNRLAQISNDFYGISKTDLLKTAEEIALEDKDYPFAYSNFGISVVGLVLEKIYRTDFTELMNDFIRTELNLMHTAVAKQSGNLKGYWQWKATDGYIPAGAIVSNIRDMAEYLKIYLTDTLPYAADTYAKTKEINANNSVYEKMNIRLDSMGLPWIRDDKNNIIWHDGGTTEFNSYMGFTADKKKGVIILSNLAPAEKISMTVIGAKLLSEEFRLDMENN